jgi:phosphoribosylformylglycinamidine cyclo-ligase
MSQYKDAGVDIAAGTRAVQLLKAAVERTHGPEVLGGIGSFGGLFDAAKLKAMDGPILVGSTDGVGTKTKVAVATGRYDTIGQCLVNHCIDDILVQGAEPMFFLDYIASSKLDPVQVATVVTGMAKACGENGCALIGGETAEMPGVYVEGEIDVAGTIVGVVDRSRLITGAGITPGDAVIGIPSTGLHTNGYSLARKVLGDLQWDRPLDALHGATIADALLAVHKSYLGEVRAIWRAGVTIKGMAHITGGGLIDNPPRVLPAHASFSLRDGSWEVLPIFRLIQSVGRIGISEMRHVFNCGVGMLVVVAPGDAGATTAAITAAGSRPATVGTIVERGDGPPVRFEA